MKSKFFGALVKTFLKLTMVTVFVQAHALAQDDQPTAFPLNLGSESHLALVLNKALPYKISQGEGYSDFRTKQGFISSGVVDEGFLVTCTTLKVFVPDSRAPESVFQGCDVEKLSAVPADVAIVSFEKLLLKAQ